MSKTEKSFLQRWRDQRNDRIALSELQRLGPHILRDIGLNPDDISAAAIGRRADDYFRR
jgi:uncharacterized protein YjiS (DUF1127 family)